MTTRTSALFTVFFVVVIDLMGFGIVLPILPFYASKFGANAFTIGFLYSIYSLMQLVFSPLWGSLSDRVGRRPIMLLSTLGSVCAYLLFSVSGSFAMLFFSRFLAGVMGGNISTAQAYVTDVTSPEDRARGMGLVGAAFGIGFVAGPAIAALLIHPATQNFLASNGLFRSLDILSRNPYAVPGLFAAALSLTSFLLVIFKLPESLDAERRRLASRTPRLSVFTGRFWSALALEDKASPRHLLPALLGCGFLLAFGQASLYSAFPLFCKTQLGLTPAAVGMQFVYMGIVAVLVQGGLIRPLVRKFGEERLFLAGSVVMACGMALLPAARSEFALMGFLVLMTAGVSLNVPTLNSLISKESNPDHVGSTLGLSQGMAAMGRAVGPTWGGFLYGVLFYLPFIITAAVLSLAVMIGLRLPGWRHRALTQDTALCDNPTKSS